MACNCIKEIPEKVKKDCNEGHEFTSPVTKVELQGIKQSALDEQGSMLLTAKMSIHIEGRSFPLYRNNYFTYCPFCGVKYRSKEGDQ